MIKLTKDEKLIALFMAVQYKYFKMGEMSETAQQLFSQILYKLSKKGGSPKGLEFDILKGLLNFDQSKINEKLFFLVNLDDFPKTKEGQYYSDFLMDKHYALKKFGMEFLKDILTEDRVDNVVKAVENFKEEIIEKYKP